jgi:hypothetical protein
MMCASKEEQSCAEEKNVHHSFASRTEKKKGNDVETIVFLVQRSEHMRGFLLLCFLNNDD